MRRLGSDDVSVAGPTRVKLLVFFNSGIQLYILLGPYFVLSRFLYLDLYE